MNQRLGRLARDETALKAVGYLSKRRKGSPLSAVAKKTRMSKAAAGKLLAKLTANDVVEKLVKGKSVLYKATPAANVFLLLADEMKGREKDKAGVGKKLKTVDALRRKLKTIEASQKGFARRSEFANIGNNMKNVEDMAFSNRVEIDALKRRPTGEPDKQLLDKTVNRVLTTINQLAVRISSLEQDVSRSIREGDAASVMMELDQVREKQELILNRVKTFENLNLIPLIKAVDELNQSVSKTRQLEGVAIEFDRFRRELMPGVKRAISSLEEDIEMTKRQMGSIHEVNAEKLKVMQPYIHRTKADIEHVKGSLSALHDEFHELKQDLRRGVVVIE